MKQKVIKFLQNLPKEKHIQFNEAFELYRQSEDKSPLVERAINASGFSDRALENLLYDLQKMHGITDVEKVAVPVKSQKSKVESEEEYETRMQSEYEEELRFKSLDGSSTEPPAGSTEVLDKSKIAINVNDLSDATAHLAEKTKEAADSVATFEKLAEQNEALQEENDDLQDELQATTEENEILKDKLQKAKALPKTDAKAIRVEFPFLNDAKCPDVFKILMADKITAWNTYVESHCKILLIEAGELITDEKSKAQLADAAVKSFAENQKIYDELNAYQETGKILGKHPIFRKLQLSSEVEEMTADELHKYKGSSAKYFSVNKKAFATAVKENDQDKQQEITTRVAEREEKLAMVNKKLGIATK